MKDLSAKRKELLNNISDGIRFFDSLGCRAERMMYYDDLEINEETDLNTILNNLKQAEKGFNNRLYSVIAVKIKTDLKGE